MERAQQRQTAAEEQRQKIAEKEAEKATKEAKKTILQNDMQKKASSKRKWECEEEGGQAEGKHQKMLPTTPSGGCQTKAIGNLTIKPSHNVPKKRFSTFVIQSAAKGSEIDDVFSMGVLKTDSRERTLRLPQRFQI